MKPQQPLKMQGRGFLGDAWRWVQEQLACAAALADEIFRQPPTATTAIGHCGLRGMLALA